MEFLKFLEGLRTPFLNEFFSFITHFGEETVFIVLGLLFFWCIDKKQGYYLLSICFIGTVINQFLKMLFRVPRPWVKDKDFTIVDSARKEATGYSFPSGHTQSSVGLFGGIARWNKNITLRIICVTLCVLIPFSRLYLGVHTPLDVGVSVIIGLILIFILYPLINKAVNSKWGMRILFSVIIILSIGLLLFVYLCKFPANVDIENLQSSKENAFKMLGCAMGFFVVNEIDKKYLNFRTEAVWWAQILKFVLGLIPVLAVKEGLKGVLISAFGEAFGGGIRYFLIILVVGIVWPLTFKFFEGLGKNIKKEKNTCN